MVTIPHFMKERRKHSRTIVWLCHRKLLLRRIVLHLQTPLSSTLLGLKSCCDRCHDNGAIGIVWVIGVCTSPGPREPSRGGDLAPSYQKGVFYFLLPKSNWSERYPEWTASRQPPWGRAVRGRQAAAAGSRGSNAVPADVAFNFILPKTSACVTSARTCN